MLNHADYVAFLAKDYDYKWEKSGRLISCGIPGYTSDRELGNYKSAVRVVDRLAPLLSDTDFLDRYLVHFSLAGKSL